MKISKKVAGVEYAIRDIVSAAREIELQGKTVDYLNIGDPVQSGFQPPQNVKQAMIDAINNGNNFYTRSEGLTEFLDGENRIKSIMLNDRKQIIDNIAIVENEINKISQAMATNPLYENSKEMARAKHMLEQELSSLRKKWSAVNEEIEKIESSSVEMEDLNEDQKFFLKSKTPSQNTSASPF